MKEVGFKKGIIAIVIAVSDSMKYTRSTRQARDWVQKIRRLGSAWLGIRRDSAIIKTSHLLASTRCSTAPHGNATRTLRSVPDY
jgi:hypothetical protein